MNPSPIIVGIAFDTAAEALLSPSLSLSERQQDRGILDDQQPSRLSFPLATQEGALSIKKPTTQVF